MSDRNEEEIREALKRLEESSLVIFRKFNNSYSIFEGSDFDIEHAVDEAYETIGEIDFSRLTVAGWPSAGMIAKRHYHKTGAIRWFETSSRTSEGCKGTRIQLFAHEGCSRGVHARPSLTGRLPEDCRDHR